VKRPRLNYANVTATLALFVALGGTSYAAIKLPKNSVGSLQVRDRSLKATDLAPNALASGTGARGPRGPEGPQGVAGATGAPGSAGPAGATGAAGPSNVVTAASRNAVPFGLNGPSSIDVVSVSVPAGQWWVLGSGSIVYDGSTGDFFRCALAFGNKAGGAASVGRFGSSPGGMLGGDLLVHEGVTLTGPTRITLRCGHDLSLSSGTPRVDHAQLTAIRTGDLQVQD
jgi:hypothetical protein